ncbi:MAG: response regulator [Polyangiaceae bacterium]|nr:response regulator [Polyangiaceae bacterium]
MSLLPEERPRILVVDDEKVIRDMLADFLGMEGYYVRTAEDGTSALTELSKSHYDLVISDLKMPRMGGIALLDEIGKTAPSALTVIMTGFGTVETAIDAMKRGAYDYVLKPFKLDEVVHVVQRGIEKQRMAAENIRLREALSLYKVSEAIAASLSLDQVLETVADSCLHEVRGDLISTWLDSGSGGLFERQSIRGAGVDPGAALGRLHAERIVEHLRPDALLLEQGQKGLRFFELEPELPLSSLVAVPLRMQNRLMGFIAVASFTRTKRFDEGQRKLLSIIGSRAAAAIENARLYEDLQATFQQTIEGLAKAIDKMDRYTAGHSDRVALYAVMLARRLGLSEDQIEIVRQSALMHDIGKIGCVLNLNKPGKLTNDEYEVFKRHPVYGRDILDPIKFLHPLIPGVHLHHERWDGRGYPLRMRGNEIPIIARIISVADTYDAMTSDRSYRRALPHEVAVAEIDRCSGSQFDPEVAGNFTGYIDEYRDQQRDLGRKVPE